MIDKIQNRVYQYFDESGGSFELPQKINEIIDWINDQQQNTVISIDEILGRVNENTPAQKARRILQEKYDIELCLKAGICPKCGELLIEKNKERKIITECSKNKDHYSDSHYIYYDGED